MWYLIAKELDVTALPKVNASGDLLHTGLQFAFALLGAISFLMVTIGGLKYVLSRGDSQAVAKAKDTILYAVIGVAIAVFAEVIVTFVVGKVGS